VNPTAVLVGNSTSGNNQEHVFTEFCKVLEEFAAEGLPKISHILYDSRVEGDDNCQILG